MSIARRLAAGRARPAAREQRALTGSAAIPPPTDWIGGDTFIGHMNPATAMRNMTVFGCVRLLSDTIATLPWFCYRDDAQGFPVKVRPTPKVVAQPMPGMRTWEWKWMNVWSLAMRGNAYNFVVSRDNFGRPAALMPLHPDLVRPEPLNGDWLRPQYRVGGDLINPDDMVHIKRYPTGGSVESLSPIGHAAATIGFALQAEEYGSRFFKDSAMPSGVLSSNAVNLPGEVVEHAQKEWIRTHGGRRLPAVLTGGFTWQAVSITPEESQFLETRGFQDQQIMRLYGIPPHMLGDAKGATSWGTGIENLGRGFNTFTLNAWLSCFEATMSDDVTPRGQYVDFDVDELLRGDTKNRMEADYKAWSMGAKNFDEVRAGNGLPPIEGGLGKVHMMPSNMVPLGTEPAAAAPEPAAAPDDDTPDEEDTGNNDEDATANDEEAEDDDTAT